MPQEEQNRSASSKGNGTSRWKERGKGSAQQLWGICKPSGLSYMAFKHSFILEHSSLSVLSSSHRTGTKQSHLDEPTNTPPRRNSFIFVASSSHYSIAMQCALQRFPNTFFVALPAFSLNELIKSLATELY